MIGGKYGFIAFFELNFERALVLAKFIAVKSVVFIIFWFGEDFLRRFVVEAWMFSLGLVWTWNGLLTYFICFMCTADLLFTIFLSNFGRLSTLFIFYSFFSISSSDSVHSPLSSVTQESSDNWSTMIGLLISSFYSSMSSITESYDAYFMLCVRLWMNEIFHIVQDVNDWL